MNWCETGSGAPDPDDHWHGASRMNSADRDLNDSVIRSRIDVALEHQATLDAAGHPADAASIISKFPDLAEDHEACLAIVYNEYQLLAASEDNERLRQRLIASHPNVADDLRRQFEFADFLASDPRAAGEIPTLGMDDDDTVDGRDAETARIPDHIGRFKIRRIVGQGGMGMVFSAVDRLLDRRVAIKVPRVEWQRQPRLTKQLVREAKIAAGLRHPNLVEIYEISSIDGSPYLVSRWAGGGSLFGFLVTVDRPIDEASALWLISEVTAGLAHCHDRGVTHLDLKPGNILFDKSDSAEDWRGFPGAPLLADFGLARVRSAEPALSRSHSIVGTPLYMAPEQVTGDNSAIGPPSDVFVCGLILAEILLGKHPLAEATLGDAMMAMRRGEIPPLPREVSVTAETRLLIAKCLQPDPAYRYADAGELHADLQRLRAGEAIRVTNPPWHAKLWRWCEREERIIQAAYVNIAFNLGLIFAFAIMLILTFIGRIGDIETSLAQLVVDQGKLVAMPHGPMIALGVLILRGRLGLHVWTALLSLVLLALIVYSFITGQSPLRIYAGNELARYVSHLLVLGFSSGMAATQLVALPAWHRERSVTS